MHRRILILLVVFLLLSLPPALPAAGQGGYDHFLYLPVVMRSSLGLTLQWSRGGCYSSWCETGWYSSPAVINIDGDPQAEIIASAYSVIALDGASGGLQWRVGGTGNRTWPGIALADINKDGQTEIVVAQSGPWVTAYKLDSTQLWRKQPSGSGGEYRGMLVADLDTANPNMDVVVTRARGTPGSETNTWVLDANGNTRTGWPQLSSTNVSNENGYAWGVYNNNAAAADLLPGSAGLELVVPSDVHYINAYTPSGGLLPVNNTVYPGKNYWGKVGVWEDLGVEQRGWGACDGVRAESYRANFADGPAVIADVNGDGTREVIAVGNMYDCDAGYPPSRYYAPYIFNADRTRFNAGGYDWRSIPVNTGAPLSEDYNVIQSASPSPVPADLDGDGKLEILFASYDGRVHAYWLDKTEHGDWPFEVTTAEDGLRFASEPLVADLNCDGKSEVIFTSWPGNTSGRIGDVFIVDYQGKLMFKSALPAGFGKNWNGALAAPTLANVDLDSNLEIVVNTINAGVAVYDIDGSAGACNLQWPTGRGNYQRTAGR